MALAALAYGIPSAALVVETLVVAAALLRMQTALPLCQETLTRLLLVPPRFPLLVGTVPSTQLLLEPTAALWLAALLAALVELWFMALAVLAARVVTAQRTRKERAAAVLVDMLALAVRVEQQGLPVAAVLAVAVAVALALTVHRT